MRIIFLILALIVLTALFLLTSCSSKTPDDPLIVPPYYTEMPDLTNPEKPNEQQKDADIARLKELLLKSE